MFVFVGSSLEEHPSRNQTFRIAQPSSIVLTGNDILTICEKLRSASKNWFNLGLALGVNYYEMENIQDRYQDNDRRLMKVVARRLEVTDPEHPMTWPYICECLRRPTVARNDVAEEIEDKCVRTATGQLTDHSIQSILNAPPTHTYPQHMYPSATGLMNTGQSTFVPGPGGGPFNTPLPNHFSSMLGQSSRYNLNPMPFPMFPFSPAPANYRFPSPITPLESSRQPMNSDPNTDSIDTRTLQ